MLVQAVARVVKPYFIITHSLTHTHEYVFTLEYIYITYCRYFIPPHPIGANDAVVVSFLDEVVQMNGANHTSFESMIISDARGAVMSLSSAANVTVSDNTVRVHNGSSPGGSPHHPLHSRSHFGPQYP